jgi:hypothetical protein
MALWRSHRTRSSPTLASWRSRQRWSAAKSASPHWGPHRSSGTCLSLRGSQRSSPPSPPSSCNCPSWWTHRPQGFSRVERHLREHHQDSPPPALRGTTSTKLTRIVVVGKCIPISTIRSRVRSNPSLPLLCFYN